jgi:hypothetical protein
MRDRERLDTPCLFSLRISEPLTKYRGYFAYLLNKGGVCPSGLLLYMNFGISEERMVLTSPSKFESGLTSLIPNVLTTSDLSLTTKML